MNLEKYIFILVCFFVITLFLFPYYALAVTQAGPSAAGNPGRAPGAGDSTLPNPLNTVNPQTIIGNIIKAVLGIVGSLALVMFVFGGFMWITSAGNDEKIKKGKDMIMWASFGLAVIFASYALVNFVIKALTGTE